MGGIANFNTLLLANCDRDCFDVRYFPIGRRTKGVLKSAPARLIEVAINPFRFAVRLLLEKPELVHLNPSLSKTSLPEPMIQLLIARMLGIPIVICFHGWDQDIATAMIKSRWIGRMLRGTLRLADHYMVVWKDQRAALLRSGFNAGDITVISVMTEISAFSAERSRKYYSTTPFRVLWASRMEKKKGVWLMLDAAMQLLKKHKDICLEFIIAGDGPEFDALRACVERHGLQEKIVMPGYVRGDAKADIFSRADLFVFPSTWSEGFPTVVIEALAFGLPVIYTPVGALADVLTDEHGICIPLDRLSSESVADCISKLLRMPERRSAMAEKGRSLVRERFAVEVVCEQVASVYRQLIAVR